MAYLVRSYTELCWVPDGVAGAALGQNQANSPGFGSALNPGSIPNAQVLRLQVAEPVPGGDSPTQANFNTAFVAIAADLNTLIATPGAFSGGTQTPLAIAQGWSTGNP